MELLPLCSYNGFHSYRKDFHKILSVSVGILAHSSSRALVWSDTNVGQKYLARNLTIYPKVVQWGWGQGSVQASQVLPHQTHLTIYLWTLICALGYSPIPGHDGEPVSVANSFSKTQP